MIKQLPVFKGYTVDVRLKEFRRIHPKWGIVFIPFDCDAGEILLNGYIKTLDENSPECKELLTSF